jgi:hypothetical protein
MAEAMMILQGIVATSLTEIPPLMLFYSIEMLITRKKYTILPKREKSACVCGKMAIKYCRKIENMVRKEGQYIVRTIAAHGLSDKDQSNTLVYQEVLRYFLKEAVFIGNDLAKTYDEEGREDEPAICIYTRTRDWLHIENASVMLEYGWHIQSGMIDVIFSLIYKSQFDKSLSKIVEDLSNLLS